MSRYEERERSEHRTLERKRDDKHTDHKSIRFLSSLTHTHNFITFSLSCSLLRERLA
jgi:hypothetical protein